jgi:hypothetical protein
LGNDDEVMQTKLADRIGEEALTHALGAAQYERHSWLFLRLLHHVSEEPNNPQEMFGVARADVVADVG